MRLENNQESTMEKFYNNIEARKERVIQKKRDERATQKLKEKLNTKTTEGYYA